MSRKGPDRPLADLPYRPCVGLLVLNPAGLVFVGRRKREAGPEHVDDTHAWQMPQGGIDPGEDPYAAALRELYEETNIRSVELLAELPDWLSYDLPGPVAGRAWRGRYRGQTQKWFALRFTGDESEIDIHHPGEGRHKAEFDAWRWERMERLPHVIIPFKRRVYEKVVEAFSGLAAPAEPAREGSGAMAEAVDRLYAAILDARTRDPQSSKTAKLLREGMSKIAKKVAEEAVEVSLDAVQGDRRRVIEESADLVYNLAVLWAEMGIAPDDVWNELAWRERTYGIAEKLPKEPVLRREGK